MRTRPQQVTRQRLGRGREQARWGTAQGKKRRQLLVAAVRAEIRAAADGLRSRCRGVGLGDVWPGHATPPGPGAAWVGHQPPSSLRTATQNQDGARAVSGAGVPPPTAEVTHTRRQPPPTLYGSFFSFSSWASRLFSRPDGKWPPSRDRGAGLPGVPSAR